MSYENATATKLLATHCAVCSRPLLDAVSVEMGIGPDCRKKYMGKNTGATEAARIEANQLVYRLALQISVNNHGLIPTDVLQAGFAIGGRKAIGEMLMADTTGASMLARIRELGFDKLADKLVAAYIPVTITANGDTLAVAAPYNEDATGAWRAIPGRKWNPTTKTNDIPAAQGRALYTLLQRYYPGKAAIGPKGPFMITKEEKPAPTPPPPPAVNYRQIIAEALAVMTEEEMQAIEAAGDRLQTANEELAKYRARQALEAA